MVSFPGRLLLHIMKAGRASQKSGGDRGNPQGEMVGKHLSLGWRGVGGDVGSMQRSWEKEALSSTVTVGLSLSNTQTLSFPHLRNGASKLAAWKRPSGSPVPWEGVTGPVWTAEPPHGWNSFFFFFINLFLFLAALGLRCCARAFSSCGEQGLLFVAVRGHLIAVASLVAERGLSSCGARALERRLSSCGARA